MWKSVFSSGFKRSRVKMGCFDVFISLTFLLSDVIVNGQTVQFFGTIVVAIKPRKIHVVGFLLLFLSCRMKLNVQLENVSMSRQKHSFLLPLVQ